MKMTSQSARRAPGKPGEEGFVLVAVIFLLAILVLSLSIAIPKVKASIQRDREIETMHRGLQYARAVKLYYKKFNAYPPSVDALVKTNEIRFLRKRYTDPMTGKDDWRPVKFGENKTPLALGFFGEPLGLGGSPLAGTGPSGGNGIAGASPIGGSGAGGSGFGGGGAFSGGSSFGGTGTGGTAAGGFGSSGFGATGTGTGSGTGSGSDSGTGAGGSTGSGSGTGSGLGSGSGPSFGGVGIVGFVPGAPAQSILLYKKKNHYNEWEFLYSPLADQQGASGGNLGTIGSPVAAPQGGTTGGTGLFGGTGSGTGSGFGSGFGSGSGGTGSTPPGGSTPPPSQPQ
ncbi:MAG TPA: type II secretion system protein [Terracidiphilus sp.]|jgi:type II secretory pathway pseudopilin PulG|nr:type II secretion system protein [Terracidiphilus sp.]